MKTRQLSKYSHLFTGFVLPKPEDSFVHNSQGKIMMRFYSLFQTTCQLSIFLTPLRAFMYNPMKNGNYSLTLILMY